MPGVKAEMAEKMVTEILARPLTQDEKKFLDVMRLKRTAAYTLVFNTLKKLVGNS